MSWHSRQRIRSAAVDAAQISGFVLAVIALWVSIFTLWETQDQIEILRNTSNETQNQVNELKKIAETNIKQVELLESALKEIQHQTIVNAYENGGKFDVMIDGCGKKERTDENGNYLGQFLSYDPIMVSERETYTTVPFRIFFTYWFYGTSAELGNRYEFIDLKQHDPFVYSPSEPDRIELSLKDILTKAENSGYTGLKIELKYSFRPFSPVKEGGGFIADQSPEHTKIFAKLTFDSKEEKWNVEDLRNQKPEIICK